MRYSLTALEVNGHRIHPESMEAVVRVVSADGALRRALVSRLTDAPGITARVQADVPRDWDFPSGDILVIPATEVPPKRCRSLVAAGIHVIVLAALPRQLERASFLAAGALAYVAMAVDLSALTDAIQRALTSIAG